MKRFVFILFCVLSLLNAVDVETELSTRYNSNILNLSEDQKDIFDNEQNIEKYKITSRDDLITQLDLKLHSKNYFFGHTQKFGVDFHLNKFMNNSKLDYQSYSIFFHQYFSSKLDLKMRYSFYPTKFVDRYKSSLDEDIYRDFDYEKNFYRADFNYDLMKKFSVVYSIDFTEYFYNEYFTEYDAKKIGNSLKFEYRPFKKLKMNLKYSFKKSDAEGEKAYSDLNNIALKNPSYEENIYSLSVYCPEIYRIKTKRISFLGKINFNERYYSSEFTEDEYHFNRDDYKSNIYSRFLIHLNKKSELELFYDFTSRNTTSPFMNVENDKNYKTNEFGMNYKIKFL